MTGISHTISVLVKGKNSLTGALVRAEASLASFRKTAESASVRINRLAFSPDVDLKAVKQASRNLTSMGTKALVAGAAISAGLGLAVRSATRFESAMAEVSTLVDTATVDMGKLSEKVKQLSVRYGQMPVKTAKALYTTISAGFADAADATVLLEGAMKLARGGITDVDVAIDGLTSILNSYGMAASEVTKVSDYMFVAMRAGKTTIGELSSELGKVTPLASSVGVSLDELLAATSALTLGGLNTAEAVTSLRGILTAVVKQTSEATKTAERLGIQFNAAAVRSMGLQKWLAHVAEKTGGSQEALSALFGRVEALTGALALTGNQARSFASILEQMGHASGATEDAFRKVETTGAAAFEKMKASLSVFMASIGKTLLPLVSKLASGISWVAGRFASFADAHPLLAKIATTLAAVTAAVLVLGGAAMLVGGQIVTAMAAVNISTGGIVIAIGAVVTGITALVTVFTTGTDEMGAAGRWLVKAWGYVRRGFYAFATPVAYGVGYLVGLLTRAWRTVSDYTAEVWPLIKEVVLRAWEGLKIVLLPQIALMKGAFVFAWGVMKAAVRSAWDFIVLTVKTSARAVLNTIKLAWHLVSGVFKALLQVLTGDWSGAWETIKDTARKAWEDIKGIFGSIADWFKGLGRILYEAGKAIIDAFVEGIKAAWGEVKSTVSGLMQSVRDLLPGSDAKEGPLSDLTASGRALMPTLARGIEQTGNAPARAVARSLGNIELERPKVSLPAPQVSVYPSVQVENNARRQTASVVFERGAFNIVVNGASGVDDLEQRLVEIFSNAAMKLGEGYA